MSWSTPTEASDITGATVTQPQLDRATITIEIRTGVTEDAASKLKARDVRLLKYAEAYQAVWEAAHPESQTSIDVQSASQDAVSYTRFNDGNEDAFILAPRARMCLSRLSWTKGKTIEPTSPWDYVDEQKYGYGDAVYGEDPMEPWVPISKTGRIGR